MGSGIAQVAASSGHPVTIFDVSEQACSKSRQGLERILARLVEKRRVDQAQSQAVLARIRWVDSLPELASCSFLIEAIVENLDVKRSVFAELESVVGDDAVLATNTSSLSITAIASALRVPQRSLGVHFFNPAPLMKLVEIVPGLATSAECVQRSRRLIDSWSKSTVVAKDTPGFIVNRVARPFYGEALRILEEGLADAATIDWAMVQLGGFRMGPFQLMDLIGNDVNLKVTETVWEAFFYDPRFRPSFTQKRMVEAGRLGRKSGRGYYDYSDDAVNPNPNADPQLGQAIVDRIVAMLINEACDAVFMGVATPDDVDLAMTKGVNYPKGLLRWACEIGLPRVLERLQALQDEYAEDRYRPNPLLKRMVREQRAFFE